MDFLTASDAPIVKSIGGKPVEFRVLTYQQIIELCAKLNLENEERAVRIAKKMKLDALATAAFVERHAAKRATPWDVNAYSVTPEGAQEVLILSLGNAGVSKEAAKEIVHSMGALDVVEVAIEVRRTTLPTTPGVTDPQSAKPTSEE